MQHNIFEILRIAGFIGATMVNAFVSIFGSYLILFIVMGLMSVGAGVLAYLTKPPKR